jgi:hypothetical protein
MRIQGWILGSVVTLLSAASLLIPQAATSQSATIAQSANQETIDGMPVLRGEICFTSPTDIDGLTSEADLIVVGQIEQSLQEAEPSVPRDDTGAIPVTYVKMGVTKVLKGNTDLENQTIKIGQHVAILNDRDGKPYIHTFTEGHPFQKGGRYLLFLNRATNGYGYFTVGLFYGRYNLDGTDTSEERIIAADYQALRIQMRELFPAD